jgi:uncharacterized protein (TIGR00299 family) protein
VAGIARLGWLDAASGISGDMLLGACVDAGVPIEVPQGAIDRLGLPERVRLTAADVTRSGIGGTHVRVEVGESHHHRRLGDVLTLLERLEEPVATTAAEVFRVLAAAEARVHRVGVDEVHFHEVGALDSIADVAGGVAAVHHLGLDRLVCSPIALGGGRVRAAHGSLPVPPPAVVELLAAGRVPAYGGPVERELATPTGVALAVVLADAFGAMPTMTVTGVGAGAGTADPETHPNLLRLLVGESEGAALPTGLAVVLEANVDDLDPRLWPGVLRALLDAGADDAWLTPMLMKKGRPAHTLSVLCTPTLADDLSRVVLRHTSTIGLRRRTTDKVALEREVVTVDVDGHAVRVKLARLDGEVVNAAPEFDDVARVAAETGRPEKVVLAAAAAAASGPGTPRVSTTS